jgi:hypothetical protein
MIFGNFTLDDEALITHRDSYRLESLSVVSVRRPLLAPAILFAFGLGGFTLAFADLLYPHEMIMLAGMVGLGVSCGLWLGQLKLLSRDLRGSDLSDVIWGSYRQLNRARRQIMTAMAGKTSLERLGS